MISSFDSFVTAPDGTPLYYQGPPLSVGPLPTIFYFALSGIASLFEDPFNQPVKALGQDPIRIFSWDIPFHGPRADPKRAIQQWALEAINHPAFLNIFIEQSKSYIDYLIEIGGSAPNRLAVAGLSRGGFIATQLAAQDSRIQLIVGFSPLTQLYDTKGLTLLTLVPFLDLLTQKHVRYYIGNRDERVGTEICFNFIKDLADHAFTKKIRSPKAELTIYPSIGHKGHGTPSLIFQEGAQWLKSQLLT